MALVSFLLWVCARRWRAARGPLPPAAAAVTQEPAVELGQAKPGDAIKGNYPLQRRPGQRQRVQLPQRQAPLPMGAPWVPLRTPVSTGGGNLTGQCSPQTCRATALYTAGSKGSAIHVVVVQPDESLQAAGEEGGALAG